MVAGVGPAVPSLPAVGILRNGMHPRAILLKAPKLVSNGYMSPIKNHFPYKAGFATKHLEDGRPF